jgi:hypothetical protein
MSPAKTEIAFGAESVVWALATFGGPVLSGALTEPAPGAPPSGGIAFLHALVLVGIVSGVLSYAELGALLK